MRFVTAPNQVTYVASANIPYPHGFSTRLGGVSSLPHTASLNLAFGRGDGEAAVFENLHRFADAVGFSADRVISLPQIHSADVRTVTADDAGLGYLRQADQACDGYVTAVPGLPIAVKTADCVPILLADPAAGVIGALHAGWRGTAAGIAREGIRKMQALGADPARIVAAIGPAIGPCCYEVGPDFVEAVSLSPCADLCMPHITHHSNRIFADLPAMNADILQAAGLSAANIDLSHLCTCCDTEHFYSHRASRGLRGTMLSVIVLPEKEG